MAKDDYHFLVFKILTYLYGCMQCKFPFEKIVFLKRIISDNDVAEEYVTRILQDMQEDGLIKGLVFKKTWGNEYLLVNDYEDMKITPKGIQYLHENSMMEKVKKAVLEGVPGAIMELVKNVFFK